jgi:hypothetical protein
MLLKVGLQIILGRNLPNLVVDYLIVAGGGGGGASEINYTCGGGGGAGGLRTSWGNYSGGGVSSETALSLNTATNYTVTVGAGGAGADASSYTGANGSNSIFVNNNIRWWLLSANGFNQEEVHCKLKVVVLVVEQVEIILQ